MAQVKRLLVLAGAAAATMDDVPDSVRELLDAADEVFVVTPTLPTKLGWIASDLDSARHEADARLDTVLGHLAEDGVTAEGAVGDDSPLTAIDDHVRAFDPDHLLIALRGPAHADWQERGLLDQVRASFELPLTVFEIP
jgi:hypothetical protein